MGEPDLAIGNGLDTFGHSMKVLADRDQVGSCIARLVAVESDPVDRAGRAILIPGVGGGKFCCFPGEGEDLHVDDMSLLAEALAPLVVGQMSGARRPDVLRRKHKIT